MAGAGVLGVGVWWLTGRLPWNFHAPAFYAVHALAMIGFAVAYTSTAIWPDLARLEDALRMILAAPTWLWNLLMGSWLYMVVAGLSYTIRAQRRVRAQEAAMTEARPAGAIDPDNWIPPSQPVGWAAAGSRSSRTPYGTALPIDPRADRSISVTADPSFTDAKVGVISCLQILGFLNRADAARLRDLVSRFVALLKQTLAEAADHPRLLWVTGQSEWYTPANAPPNVVHERQARAIATYERGLRLARAAPRPADGLEPSWGEPELLMNLAWAHLNKMEPDVAAAESYARQALALVPDWQYVRDILMPQIQRARQLASGASIVPSPR